MYKIAERIRYTTIACGERS